VEKQLVELLLNSFFNFFTVENYCIDVARHSLTCTSDCKNASKAQSVENSQFAQDDEQVCAVLNNLNNKYLINNI